jgi:ubiquinone/menaquinone biosynthesis C-methylase UbiE
VTDRAAQQRARVDPDEIPALYDRLSRIYDQWAALTESRARRLALQRAECADGMDILEIAVGTGQLFAQLVAANPHGRTRGIDISPRMLARAHTRVRELAGDAQLEVANAHALPFPKGTFDRVIVSYLFDLLPEESFPAVIAEIRRVVRDKGRVVVIDMTIAERRRDDLYRWVYRLWPKLLGGCRGVRLTTSLTAAGLHVIHRDYVSQLGFPSEVLTSIAEDESDLLGRCSQ